MANEVVNKVVVNGVTKIDLTGDNIDAAHVLKKVGNDDTVFHLPSGATANGTCDYDVNSSAAGENDIAVTAAEILIGPTVDGVQKNRIAYVNGAKVTGSMVNQGSKVLTIDDADDEITIPQGYHDGTGKAKLDATEKAKIIPGNIKNGVNVLGVEGTYTGSELIKATGSAYAYAGFADQTLLPGDFGDFDYFTQFVVKKIKVDETLNSAGGYTCTISQDAD